MHKKNMKFAFKALALLAAPIIIFVWAVGHPKEIWAQARKDFDF